MEDNRPMTIDDEIAYNNYKLTADKILQLLSQIREDPSASAKRWVWELLQNAKDVPNRFGKVSVVIELLSKDTLQFRHNGDKFTTKNITGLVQQVSSKDSQNKEGQTGKFGTGFICTHLLSDIIDVDGIVTYQGVDRRFHIVLDRSGYRSEELLPRIESTLEELRHIKTAYEQVDNYEVNRSEQSFDTVFTYHLTTEEKFNSAVSGLEDLINTLPVTLVTQSDKIKQVRVINRLKNTDVTYVCNSRRLEDNVQLSTVKIGEITKSYLSYITDEVALTTEVNIVDGRYEIVKRDSKQPVLYRDFPLIGSDKFYFPYILNGFNFNPTERRNGLVLNSADHPNCVQNREIVNHAVDAALKFNEWLISNKVTNRYLLASSRIPESTEKYSENVAAPWIKNLQLSWRNQLLDENLVETDHGIDILRNLSVPTFSPSATKEVNERFYNLINGCYLGRGVLPKIEYLHGWIEVIRPEYDAWGTKLKYEKEDFLKDLAEVESINALCTKLGKTKTEAINWLNDVYKFLIDQNCLSDFDSYAIIPNMEGYFKKLKELWSDASDPIPEELMTLRNHVMTNTLQSLMMDSEIETSVFGNTLQVFALTGMIEWFNKKIKSTDTYTYNGKSYYMNSWLAYSLIEYYPSCTEDKEYCSYRQKLYDFSAVDGNQDEFKPLTVSNAELWREADSYWFSHNYQKIEEKENVEKLIKEYFISEKTNEEALSWLNDYYQFYRDNSKGDFLKDKRIFPNQRLKFKTLNELRYDSGVEEAFKDLAEYAVNIDFSQEKYQHILLHPSITGYEQHNPLTLKEVYEFVKGVFDKSSGSIQDVIAKHTIAIIAKSSSIEGEEEAQSSEKQLYDFTKTFFGDSVPDINYVTKSNGFNWGFAQEFYLRKLCSEISESVNLEGLKETSSDFSQKSGSELIEWIDSLIEFLHTFKNKKYWPVITDADNGFGIWLNQNNDFCRFQDVCKDNNVPNELKDLAAGNKHVSHDFREEMFTLESAYDSYLETNAIDLNMVGKYIDGKIQDYDGDKQDKDFAALIFTIGKLCSTIPGLLDIMDFYREKKNTLIVGSLGEGETLDLVGSIIQQGNEKIKAVNDLLNNNTLEEINNVSDIIRGCHEGQIKNVKDILQKIINGEITNPESETPTAENDETDIEIKTVPRIFEIEFFVDGKYYRVPTNQSQYAGLSLEEIIRYVKEAKAAVVKYFKELNERHHLGLRFDNDRIMMNSYSQLYGIYDEYDRELPLVVHSYKGPQYRYFDLNWYDWQLLDKPGSMLWVLTVSGLQCIPLYALPVRSFNISIDNSMPNDKRAALLTLASVGKEYGQISFDFGNNMPHGFKEFVPFRYVPNNLRIAISTIKQACDTQIPFITNIYNSGKNIPLVSTQNGLSQALKYFDETGTMRDLFEAPENNLTPPSIGADINSLLDDN